MGQSVCVIPATSRDDFRQFWHMFDNCIVEMVHQGIFDDTMLEWFLSDRYRRDFDSRCHQSRSPVQVFLIDDEDGCIGFCTCTCEEGRYKRCTISAFFLRGAYRGRGLGRDAWKEMEKTLCGEGVSQFVTADTCASCPHFWDVNGFHQTGTDRWEKRRRRSSLSVLKALTSTYL